MESDAVVDGCGNGDDGGGRLDGERLAAALPPEDDPVVQMVNCLYDMTQPHALDRAGGRLRDALVATLGPEIAGGSGDGAAVPVGGPEGNAMQVRAERPLQTGCHGRSLLLGQRKGIQERSERRGRRFVVGQLAAAGGHDLQGRLLRRWTRRLRSHGVAPAVGDAGGQERNAHLRRELADGGLLGFDPFGPHLGDGAGRQLDRPDTPADAGARLQDRHFVTGEREVAGGRQAGQAGADHRDAGSLTRVGCGRHRRMVGRTLNGRSTS
jgi:hypothetical protein